MNKSNFIKLFFLMRKKDYIFFNWIENSIIKNKKFSFLGFLKVFFLMIMYRISLGTLVFVKHNNYPHDCGEKDIKISVRAIEIFEKIANKVVIHSIPDIKDDYFYIPHPLYKEPDSPELINTGYQNYLIFGRILPYKKIEKVIEVFPHNKNLIIAGACDDDIYLKKIKNLCLLKPNVEILPRFLKHNEIKSLVKKSAGILITHNDDDMIVSGSFFYAMTLKSKVYALETPFFKWAEEMMGGQCITTFQNLNDLSDKILLDSNIELVEPKSTMIDLFGEETMHKCMSNFFDGKNI
ncbi:hypothetical protein [Acinetobacter lwoffii]|uniref:hypothetical protein n=1 Tax=Acinetobacter lwoffii TaxID=28090 RepID=UPI00168D5303|nr:hypothetical protein [Acinetobacter lwoffii]